MAAMANQLADERPRHPKRAGDSRRSAGCSGSPRTIEATSRPVSGASVTPSIPWPVAKTTRGARGCAPITGSPSGVHGRRPRHVSRGRARARRGPPRPRLAIARTRRWSKRLVEPVEQQPARHARTVAHRVGDARGGRAGRAASAPARPPGPTPPRSPCRPAAGAARRAPRRAGPTRRPPRPRRARRGRAVRRLDAVGPRRA